MRQKIYDILPPQLKEKKEKKEKRIEKKSHFPFKIILISILLLAAFLFINAQAHLTLVLKPYQEDMTINEEIKANTNIADLDIENKLIPVKIFEKEKEIWQEFSSTGEIKKEEKAKGKIKVYNNSQPPTPINLRAGTRFLSSEKSKYFRCPEKIYLPAPKVENGKIIPSVVEIEIEALESGSDYNIGPSKFSVPGLVGTPYYYIVYGESNSSMSGGFKEVIKKVTEEDIEKAKNSLNQRLLEEAKKSLKEEILTSDFILVDETVSQKIIDISCPNNPGKETENFICQGKIKINGLAFKNSDFKKISQELIGLKIPARKKLIEETIKFEYLIKKTDLKKEEIELNLKISAKLFNEINFELLKEKISLKSKKEIEKIIFDEFSQIEKIEMKFWPFWLQKAPKDLKRIEIKLF